MFNKILCRSLSGVFFIVIFSLFSLALMAQTTTNSGQTGELQPPVIPSASDTVAEKSLANVLPRANLLKKEFEALDENISDIINLDKVDKEQVAARARLLELNNRFAEVKKSGTYGFEQLSQLRSDAKILLEVITRHSQFASERLKQSEVLKQTWIAKEDTWASIRTSFADGVNPSLISVFKDVEKTIKAAIKNLSGIETPLVTFQQKVLEVQSEVQQLNAELDKLMTTMRKDLFRKSRPAMFTPTFIAQFNSSVWDEFWMGLATLELPSAGFYSTYGWIFVLQLIIFGVAVYFFKTLKNRKIEQLKLDFIFQRYISASLLLGILLPMPLFEDKPRLVSLVLAGIIMISAARLVAGIIERPWRRRLIYMIVTIYLLVQFFSFITLPTPLMRLFIAAVGLGGAAFCRWRARINKDDSTSLLYTTGVKLGGVSMMLVFLSQVAGYVAFSSHLLDATIKTVFLGLIAWMIDLVARGALEMLFDNELIRKNKIVDKHYKLFIKRGNFIVDVLVVFMAVSSTLSVWGFFDTATAAAEMILSLGFGLQELQITIGLLVSAVVALYVTLFISWLTQCVLNEEVYPRKKVERGVGISINRLIHYAFIVVGVALAFSTLGIGMQNLTVIIGAFGIGIGFGLQNIVNNFASGLILLFERSIKVGDVVQVGGEWGLIKNLGLRATVVETFDRSELIVPNSDLVSSQVTNWTLTDRQVRLIAAVGVAYGSDLELATRILTQIAQDNPYVMKFPAPTVLFLNFGASSLDLELRCWVADIDNRLIIKDEIYREIDRLFRQNNIEIPFSQHDLHIRTMDKPFKDALTELKTTVAPQSQQPHAMVIPEQAASDKSDSKPDNNVGK